MLRYLFSGYSALLSSIEVNTSSIFFWITRRLISFAWGLLAFNVTFPGTFYSTSNTPATFGIIILDKSLENNVETVVQVLMKRSCQYFLLGVWIFWSISSKQFVFVHDVRKCYDASVKEECWHFSYLWRFVCKYLRLANVTECFYRRWKVLCSTFNLTNVSVYSRMINLKGFIR